MSLTPTGLLTDAQLKAEIERCEYCAEKPCMTACPADCSPADFIMAIKCGAPRDYLRAAAMILAKNPLGVVCGLVCPDTHCMAACAREGFDRPINIPAIQATIIAKARALGGAEFSYHQLTGRRVAIIGGGPAGYAAAAHLAQQGHHVEIFETTQRSGGMAALIPPFRLDPAMLEADLNWISGLGDISIHKCEHVSDPAALLQKRFHAVIVAAGLTELIRLGLPGEEHATPWRLYLDDPEHFAVTDKNVAIIGGGAVAADCALTAVRAGARQVELFTLESLAELPLTAKEREGLLYAGIHVSGRTRVTGIVVEDDRIIGLTTCRVNLPVGATFHPGQVKDVFGTDQTRPLIDVVIIAIGARSTMGKDQPAGVFLAGDVENGPTTVVEAVASGKNAAQAVEAFLRGESAGEPVWLQSGGRRKPKSHVRLSGYIQMPVLLHSDFFGLPIISPLLLSAAPPTDGYEQMKKAYEAGWAGGVMKTAFDGVDIHIPSQYMVSFTPSTYGNCDNVSGHSLDRVCREIEQLRREFPERLTMGSTGGPVTGNDESDCKVWQSNTAKLESAGAVGIEYSLSCPQGGDGTKGDIVSQDAELTAKIIDWILAASHTDVPKLFKLTAAVTSIYPIITAIKEVFARYPQHKAGVTLANTFPTLAFRTGVKQSWDEGIVVGMSGEGVAPISNLTLANVSFLGVVVSGNGGVMNYKAAADFLALGARTVQVCTVVMKYGYGIVDELHSGLSHLLRERGMASVAELIGCALPNPITGFMDLPSTKLVSSVKRELCQHCGNCTRCPYLAITLDGEKIPTTDASRCIGCSLCAQKCFSGALSMRARTPEELAVLNES